MGDLKGKRVYFNVKVSKNKTFFCDKILVFELKKIGGIFLKNRM